MKSELELVREFSELNEAKVDSWGALPNASEKRFRELKAYFEDLMARRSTERIPLLDRHEAFEIRSAIIGRERLRIPAEMSVFFCHDDAYAPARSLNLSRGGLFVGSDVTLHRGDRMTLYMPNLGRGYENLFETTVDVVWSARNGQAARRGMGVRFQESETGGFRPARRFPRGVPAGSHLEIDPSRAPPGLARRAAHHRVASFGASTGARRGVGRNRVARTATPSTTTPATSKGTPGPSFSNAAPAQMGPKMRAIPPKAC